MPTTDHVVAVLGAAGSVGSAVESGLRRAGHVTTGIDDRGLATGPQIEAAIRAAVPDGATAVVDTGFFDTSPVVAGLAGTAPETWRQQAEQPLRRALHVLQAAHRCLRPEGGTIVVLLPSVVMSGAAEVVGWVCAAEGYRSLAKAAARAWGNEGTTLKVMLVPAGIVTAAAIDRPGLQPPALGRAPDLSADIAPALSALLDPRLGGVTGLTLAVDGGVWMTS
ncbi:MAG TPA: SDR family oxidoreductase [Mycobacteriales bacterium]|nr:SDR family oxidoreductase [Mycobacteriales bacterium]HWA66301.1 SDR family oxidoreductase [Mycobacteriales bacterium]